MTTDSPSNEELQDAARKGEEGTLAGLVERYRARLKRQRLKDEFQGMSGGSEGI
jgi:hypothetical protein